MQYTIKRKLFAQLSDGSYASYQNLGMKTSGNAGTSIGTGSSANTQGVLGNAKATTSTLDWKNMTEDQRRARKEEILNKKKTITNNAEKQVNKNVTTDAIRQNEKKLNSLFQDQLSNPNTTIKEKNKIINQNKREAKNIVKTNAPTKVTGTNAFMNNTQFSPNRLSSTTPKTMSPKMGWGQKAALGGLMVGGAALGYNLLSGNKKKEE